MEPACLAEHSVPPVAAGESSRTSEPYAALIAILLLALALRLAPWGQNRFLEDEALYAYWGQQIATGADTMLDMEPVDKPPLYPYTLALSFLLTPPLQAGLTEGRHEMVARLPSLFASVAGIALVYALGRDLYAAPRVGLLAALLVALAPFDILFASTVFTDPLMTTLVLGTLLMAAKGRLGAAGVLSALAVATKQQSILFLPLIVVVAALSPSRPSTPPRLESSGHVAAIVARIRALWDHRWLRFALGSALVVAGVLWWDLSRAQRPGFLEQSLISYGGLGLAEPEALVERLVDWLRLVGNFWASPWFNGLLLVWLAGWIFGGLLGWWSGPSKIDLALFSFFVLFLAIHWLIGFQIWDRYLLGLVPLAALLAARAFVVLGEAARAGAWQRLYAIGLGLALVLSLAGPLLHATRSELPMGGDHGAYDGINDLATYVRSHAPQGAVLYHYWLGYHYRFYLYGTPLRLHWYPDLEDLARDATVYRREPRYIAFPSWRDSTKAEAALANAGIHLVPVHETVRRDGTVSFRLYRLEGP